MGINPETVVGVINSAKKSFDKQNDFSDERRNVTDFAARLDDCPDGQFLPSVPISWLRKRNIRKYSTSGVEFEQLKLSIEKEGIVNLPTVTTHKGYIYIVDGHRRIEALKMAGVEVVDCILKHGKTHEIENLQAMANLASEDMTLLERAEVTLRFEDQGMSINEIAKRLRMDRKKASKLLMLAKWPISCKKIVEEHPKKLNQSRIFKFIRAELSEKEIIDELETILSPRQKHLSKKNLEIQNRIDKYVEEHELTEESSTILRKALIDLGFITID